MVKIISKELLNSALAQIYEDYEIIVINDGSTDKTEEIAMSYGEKIRYFKKENGGQSSALNYGIHKMKGEYFSWLSHDDEYFPNKIECQISLLKQNDKLIHVILYSNFELINHCSRKIRDVIIPSFDPSLFRLMLLISSPINGCTALIPKKAFEDIGLFNLHRPHTSDYELFFNMASKYTFIHMPQILVKQDLIGNRGQM